jgi:RNA polymerase sigma factor (sigma-70 family)
LESKPTWSNACGCSLRRFFSSAGTRYRTCLSAGQTAARHRPADPGIRHGTKRASESGNAKRRGDGGQGDGRGDTPMHVMLTEATIGRGPAQLPYVPHRRLRMAAAAEQAIHVCAWIARPEGQECVPDEADFFVALHASAYRAGRHQHQGSVMPEELRQWRERYQGIRRYLAERHLGLAYAMAGRYRGSACEQDDLVSAAMGALLRAIEQFDPWKGYRFSSYACTAIVRELTNHGRRALRYQRRFPFSPGVALEPAERVDTRTELYVERLHRALDINLGDLNALESRVLAQRFPLDHKPQSTLSVIGRAVGLSKERVRQIQNTALRKLRAVLVADPVLQ